MKNFGMLHSFQISYTIILSCFRRERIAMRKQSEKVVKSRVEWRKQNEVKKLHIVMTVVAVFLCLSVAAGAGLAWMQMKNASDKLKQSSLPSAAPASGSAESLPVYDDTLNLMLVNSSKRISDSYRPELTDYGSVRVDGRIVPALDKLMKAAKSAGCPLTLAAGYVDGQTQEKDYQAESSGLWRRKSCLWFVPRTGHRLPSAAADTARIRRAFRLSFRRRG